MATIKQTASGNYSVLVYSHTDANGKRKYKSITAPTKSEVRRLMALFLAERDEKADRTDAPTLGDAITAYIDERCNLLSPSTIAGYRKIQRNYFADLADTPIDEITAEQLQRRMNADAATLSYKSVRNNYGFLTSVLKANDRECSLKYPPKKRTLRRLPEPSEIYAVVRGTAVELPVLLAMWLSLRMSEVLGIRYADIEGGRLIIRNVRLLVDGEVIDRDTTKTESSTRVLALPEHIRRLCGEGKPDEHVVKLTANAVTKRFYKLCEKHGVPHISFHDLRHINASVMLRLGVSDAIAMERGGWSSTAVLKSVYQETFTTDREQADAMVDAYFTTMLDGNK